MRDAAGAVLLAVRENPHPPFRSQLVVGGGYDGPACDVPLEYVELAVYTEQAERFGSRVIEVAVSFHEISSTVLLLLQH